MAKTDCSYDLNNDERAIKYARENLNETDEIKEASLTEIRRWLTEEQAQLNARLEDQYLLAFLRGSKFNVNKTKKKLINYYTMRKNVPEWFSNRDPSLPELQELIKLGAFLPLRKTQDNKIVVIAKAAAHDPSVHTQDNVFKVGNMMVDVVSLENVISAHIYGIICIIDLSDIHFGHAKDLTPNMIKKAVTCWQNYHIRPKNIEFVNAPVTVQIVVSIFKSFMSDKLKKRVRTHDSEFTDLFDVVSKEILPPEYGGTGDTVEELIEYWNAKILSYRNWFLEDEKYKAQ